MVYDTYSSDTDPCFFFFQKRLYLRDLLFVLKALAFAVLCRDSSSGFLFNLFFPALGTQFHHLTLDESLPFLVGHGPGFTWLVEQFWFWLWFLLLGLWLLGLCLGGSWA